MRALSISNQIFQILEGFKLGGSFGAKAVTTAHIPVATHTPSTAPPIAKPAQPAKPAAPPTQKRTGPRLSLSSPDFSHNRKRVNDMTPKQLMTRLGRITTPQKLFDTARILASESDRSKRDLAVHYFEKLRSRFGYDDEGYKIG